jgi:hypothetical protein
MFIQVLCLLFLTNILVVTLIPGTTFIPDSRVHPFNEDITSIFFINCCIKHIRMYFYGVQSIIVIMEDEFVALKVS